MRFRSLVLNAHCRLPPIPRTRRTSCRFLLTLAIETSCDDTSVAVLEKQGSLYGETSAILHFHKKITSNNTEYHGVHPLKSLYSHQENLASLVDEAVLHLPPSKLSCSSDEGIIVDIRGSNDFRGKRIPDFISVTRGPGMRSNLFTGLDTAKGLAAAWQIDLVGVNHMQAHALTPRLVAALQNPQPDEDLLESYPMENIDIDPAFPFLSVLASGGHTLIIHSASLTHHEVMATTSDIAVGECLDKIARAVLPPEIIQRAKSTMYGALLENFAFSDLPSEDTYQSERPEIDLKSKREQRAKYRLEDNTAREYQAMYHTRYAYTVPRNNEEASKRNNTKWGWAFNAPLTKAAGGNKISNLEMSFSGLTTAAERAIRYGVDISTGKLNKVERSAEHVGIEERRDMAREAMRAAFEHVASRVLLGLHQIGTEEPGYSTLGSVVMSGGVAANSYFRLILASTLAAHGYADIRLVFPPPSLCTDNAAMIAWTGIEMYQAGYRDSRTIKAIRKWPLDQLLSPQEN